MTTTEQIGEDVRGTNQNLEVAKRQMGFIAIIAYIIVGFTIVLWMWDHLSTNYHG